MLEKSFGKNNGISLGFKQIRTIGKTQVDSSNFKELIVEYKRYFFHKNQKYYGSPYLKYRHLIERKISGGESGTQYTENSFGLGATIGRHFKIDKRGIVDITVFLGGGYYFPISGEKNIYNDTPPFLVSRKETEKNVNYRLDMRVGAFIGLNWVKSQK